MAHMYNRNLPILRKLRINHFSAKLWRSMYLIVSNPVHNTSEKRIYSRSSVVPTIYIGSEVIIHSGKRWHRKFINKWLIGFRFGEFTWNRRLALYKAKQMRKKNKKLKSKK